MSRPITPDIPSCLLPPHETVEVAHIVADAVLSGELKSCRLVTDHVIMASAILTRMLPGVKKLPNLLASNPGQWVDRNKDSDHRRSWLVSAHGSDVMVCNYTFKGPRQEFVDQSFGERVLTCSLGDCNNRIVDTRSCLMWADDLICPARICMECSHRCVGRFWVVQYDADGSRYQTLNPATTDIRPLRVGL